MDTTFNLNQYNERFMLVVHGLHRDHIVAQGISFFAFYHMEKEPKNNTWDISLRVFNSISSG